MIDRYLYTIFLLSILLFFTPRCYSVNKSSNTLSYNLSELPHVPQNDVNCIFKDSHGFMWIGTLDGLFRFDGYDFKEYRVDAGEYGPSSNLILDIDEDRSGNIWIATFDKGLCKFNPENEKFTYYHNTKDNPNLFNSNDITCMLIDNENVMWTGNWFGLNRIELDSNMDIIKNTQISVFENNNVEIEKKNIREIHKDKNNNIWIGTNSSLFRCLNPYAAKDSIKLEYYPLSSVAICNSDSGLLVGGKSLYELKPNKHKTGNKYSYTLISEERSRDLFYKDNMIWLGDRKGIFTIAKTADGGWKKKNHYSTRSSEERLNSNIIYCITADNNGQIWVGTRGGGINIFNPNRKKFKNYKHTPLQGSIANNLCRSIFEDSHRNLWIGTEEGGVSMLPFKKTRNYNNGFKHFSVSNNITDNRVYAIEETFLPNSSKHNSIIWLGTTSPTCLIALDPETFTRKKLPDYVSELGFIFAIEVQNDSTLWAGTYGNGLVRINLNKEGDIKGYTRYVPEKNNAHSISSHIIRSILKDRTGNIWIGTDKGLNRISKDEIDKPHPKFEVFTKGGNPSQLNHDYILQIYEARNGKIWVGTMGGGLLCYEEPVKSHPAYFTKLTVKDGLPNNSIKSIVEDRQGNLWLSSNKGLSRYNPLNGDIINYNISDGLQDNEFAEICALKRANGQFVFGGLKGFSVFYPNNIVVDTLKPQMFLTDFYLYNKLVKPGQKINDNVILPKALSQTKTIELKHKENSFSIGFVALHYNDPLKNNYKYKLEGFDKQWYPASATYRLAKYTNIPSGKYTFKVRGSNSDNCWSNQPAKVDIIIAPPFYQSRIAFLLYIIVLIIIIYIQQKISRIFAKRKNETLIAVVEKKKVEELSQMKLRFFTNISHEFRTPLSLINAPLDKLIKSNDANTPQQVKENQQLIKQNVNIMMRLINQLMDFRKVDQQKMKLHANRYNLIEFVQAIHNSFSALAEQKEINFNFVCKDTNIGVWFDADKLEKIIYNLLSNAFKFTPQKGEIEIGVSEIIETNEVVIFVKDSGPGIDKEEESHIFERYYQTDKKNKNVSGGTGIGLALSKGLVELHHGSIHFEKNQEAGTTFFINLPQGNQHLTPDEIDENKVDFTISEIYTPLPATNNLNTEQKTSTKNVERKKLLIVEDNYDLRQFLISGFTDNYDVIDAEDGVAGLELCKKHQPNVVISDVMMPRMDGIEMCKHIKTDEETSHIPVILLTAKDAIESQIEGFDIGADSYLTKPFDYDVLKARVASVINNREQLRLKFQKEIKINPSIIANNSSDSNFIDKILAIIEEHISDSEFSVEHLAESYGVSRNFLNKKIKALTGETTNQFIRNIRLKHAAELLQQGTHTISEVTWAVGYNDLKTFRGRFKEKFGVSPSEYLKENK